MYNHVAFSVAESGFQVRGQYYLYSMNQEGWVCPDWPNQYMNFIFLYIYMCPWRNTRPFNPQNLTSLIILCRFMVMNYWMCRQKAHCLKIQSIKMGRNVSLLGKIPLRRSVKSYVTYCIDKQNLTFTLFN